MTSLARAQYVTIFYTVSLILRSIYYYFLYILVKTRVMVCEQASMIAQPKNIRCYCMFCLFQRYDFLLLFFCPSFIVESTITFNENDSIYMPQKHTCVNCTLFYMQNVWYRCMVQCIVVHGRCINVNQHGDYGILIRTARRMATVDVWNYRGRSIYQARLWQVCRWYDTVNLSIGSLGRIVNCFIWRLLYVS